MVLLIQFAIHLVQVQYLHDLISWLSGIITKCSARDSKPRWCYGFILTRLLRRHFVFSFLGLTPFSNRSYDNQLDFQFSAAEKTDLLPTLQSLLFHRVIPVAVTSEEIRIVMIPKVERVPETVSESLPKGFVVEVCLLTKIEVCYFHVVSVTRNNY